MRNAMSDTMESTERFTINSVPVSVTAECPYCGVENTDDVSNFDWCDLWHGQETMECENCHREFELQGAEYD